jgi:hypothetical protein
LLHDLLSMNYDGAGSKHFRKCVTEAAEAVNEALIASWRDGAKVIVLPSTAVGWCSDKKGLIEGNLSQPPDKGHSRSARSHSPAS